MKNTIYLLFIFFGTLTLTSNRSGRTGITGQGVSGAPGESGQTCGSFGCHSNGTFDPNVVISLLNESGEAVTSYLPNQKYTVNLKINHTGSPAGYGFQIVSLLDSDNSGINTFSNLTSQMQEIQSNGRQYVEQNTIINNDLIKLEWTAPEKGSGSISFYGIGNAVNGNGNSAGDGAQTTSLNLEEDLMSSIINTFEKNIKIYPNPSSNFININTDKNIKKVSIYNIQGKLVLQKRTGESRVDISELTKGIYFVQVQFESNQIAHHKIIVSK